VQNFVSSKPATISLSILGCHIAVYCHDAEAHDVLVKNYSSLQGNHDAVDLIYSVGRLTGSRKYVIARTGRASLIAEDAGELLFMFEKDFTIALQTLRRDLYFVHSAVLEWDEQAIMLVAPSGYGKSTTTWALLHHGFQYYSDELAPLDLNALEVHPYPHALCLKREPPAPYLLPPDTLYTSRTLHIPTEALPSKAGGAPKRVVAIFFVQYHPKGFPTVRPMRKAEAAMRLFVHALNPLAHPEDGLDGAVAITMRSTCFELRTADLPATCALMIRTLRELS